MKENSIEEDMKILEGIIKGDEDCINAIYSRMKVKNDNDEDIQYYKKEIQSIKNIVNNYLKEKARADKLEKEYSAMLTELDKNECDYKRVLKENEEKTTILLAGAEKVKQLEKENEKLKQEKINNHKMMILAQNEALGYMQGYEDGKNSRTSAIASIVENQQYYIIREQIEKYEENIKKLQTENKELKKFITEGITIEPHSTYENYQLDFLRENFISVQKIEEKMQKDIKANEHIILGGRRNGKTLEYGKRLGRIEMCKELLESEE